jgi:small subunit ribosomal protein S20
MANHKNTKKAIRTNAKKRLLNRYQAVTSRNLVKKLRATTDHSTASDLLKTVISKLDRLAKKNIIHKNKAANNKSKLTRFVNKLAPATAA